MASAEVPDHRSLNLLKLCELAPGVYERALEVSTLRFLSNYSEIEA